jgi:Ni/Fe-hydrogenase subunit HybB-like protein
MVIFESTLSSKAFGHKLDKDIVSGLGKFIPYILGIYLVVKVADLIVRGDIGLLFTEYPQNLLWWAEIIIGVILPITLFSLPSIHQSKTKIFWSAVLVVAGLIINRFNVSVLALAIRPGYSYFPSLMEFAISIGLIVMALLVIQLANRLLPIVPHHEAAEIKEEIPAPPTASQAQQEIT